MDATEVLDKLSALGITARAAGEKLLLEPGSKVPADLMAEVREHKVDITSHLRREERVGDGQLPPLSRPPATEQELRRLMDYLDDPIAFSRWLESLMGREE